MALQDVINQLQQGGADYNDPVLQNQIAGLIGQASTTDPTFDTNRANLNTQFQQYQTQLGQNEQTAMQSLRDRYGYTGLINSGVYLGNQGQEQNQFQNMLQNAVQRRVSGLAGIDQQQAQFESQLLQALGTDRGSAADRQAQAQQAAAQLAAQQQYDQQMMAMQQQAAAQQSQALQQMIAQQRAANSTPPQAPPPPPPPTAPAGPPPRPGGQPPVPGAVYQPDPTGQGLPGAWYDPGTGHLLPASQDDANYYTNTPQNYDPASYFYR